MKKRLLFLCLTMLLVPCLASCNSSDNSDAIEDDGDGPESDAQIEALLPKIPETPNDKDSWLYSEGEFDITWHVDYSWFSYPNSGSDEISKEIKRLTGVTVRFTSPLEDDGQMLASMIGAGSLPDVVSVKAYTPTPTQLANQRYVWPLDTLARKWAPSLLDRIEPDIYNYFKLSNGHIYALPSCAYSSKYVKDEDKWAPNGSLLVRKDWYEWYESQPDKKDITTKEGLVDAMLKVREQFTGTGQGKVKNFVPMLLDQFNSEGNNSVTWLSQYFASPFEDENGNYIDQRKTPQYQETLEFLNSLFRQGLIKESNLSATADSIGGNISRGEAFLSLITPQNYTGSFINAFNNNIEYIPLIVRNDAGEDPVLQDLTGTGFICSMITKNAKNIDKIIKVFDFLYSEEGQRLCSFGIEGQTWNWNSDKTRVKWTNKYLQMKQAGTLDTWGFGRFNVMYNHAYIEPISPLEGKTAAEAYFDNLKRPLSCFSYRYGASWPKLDVSRPDYNDHVRKQQKVLSVWSEKLVDIIKAKNEGGWKTIYDSAMSSMVQRGFDDVCSYIARDYLSNKELLGISYGWPLNNPSYTSPKMKGTNEPIGNNGDPSYILDYVTNNY